MANPTKILTLGFKINIDAAGKAKLDKLTEGVEKGLDSANAKTKSLIDLEAKRGTLLGDLALSQKTLVASITKQNEALSKNNSFYQLAETYLTTMVGKHNQISDSIQKEVSDTIQLINATKSYNSLVGDIQGKLKDDVGTAARQAKLLDERKAREKETIAFLSDMETRKTTETASLAKFHIEANANLDRVTTTNVINEKIALYNSLYDKIDARAKVAAEALRPSGTFNYATGATIAKPSIVTNTDALTKPSIVTNTDALTKNKVAADAAAKTHTNLFLRVGEAIGAYRVWNTTLMYSKEALMAIPKAGIELQSTKAALFGIFGSEQGAKNMQFLSELANNAGQSLLGLEQAYRRYAPSAILAGASQDEINKSFKDFAEVGTILHLPEEKLNSLFLALDQMFAKGVVQSEEIKKQLGNVLPGAVEIGAKAMGKSPADFMEAMSKNLVTAKDFVPKFAAIYRQTFGGADDSVFESIRNKLLSNLQRVQNEYLMINRDIYDITKSTMNDVVRTIAEALAAIREHLTGIGQAFQIFAGLITLRLGVALVSALSNITLGIQKLSATMAILTGVSNPVALALAAVTVAIVATYANLNKLSISYDSATGFMVNFKNSQVTLTSYLKATAIVTIDNLRESFNGLFKTRTTGEEWSTWLSTNFALVRHPIDTLKQSIFQLISAQDALFHMGSVDTPSFGEAYTAKLTELMKADQERVGTFNAEVLATAQKIDIDNLIASFEGNSAKLVSDAIKQKRLTTNEEITRALALTEDIPAQVITPPKETPPKGDAVAANKALKEVYKDLNRETKLAVQETETLLDELASKYAGNLVSIKDYYAKRVALQLANVEVEKTIQEKWIARASAAGDAASVEKARDQIELLNEKAKQFQPIADKERINDLRTYNATLANTTASYLEMTGATLAAAKARLEIQNAPLKQQLQTQIGDVGSTPAEKAKATNVLGQVTAGEEITKINAAFEAAKRYREQINEIKLAYTQMGATSSDVLTASLGGYAPLFNLFDNFQLKQAEMLVKMQELIAEGDRLSQISTVIPAGDTEALAANKKAIEINAKQTQLLDTETAKNKIKTGREAFLTVENLMKAGSKEQKIMHVASMAYNVAEKFGVLETLAVKGASATLTQGSGDPYSAFARMAAMAALVASIIAAVGGNSKTVVTNTAMPVSTGAGTVLGDGEAISTSLTDSITLLTDAIFKNNRAIVHLSAQLLATDRIVNNIIKQSFTASNVGGSNALLNPSTSVEKSGSTGASSTVKTVLTVTAVANAIMDAVLMTNPVGLIILALTKIPFIGKIVGKMVNFFVESFFGKVTYKKLDEGIMLAAGNMAKDLLDGQDLLITQYTTMEKTTKTWFSKKRKIYDEFQVAAKSTTTLFTSLYRSISETIFTMAQNVGQNAIDAFNKYKFPVIKLSFLNKNSKDITEMVRGVMSAQMDLIAEGVFGAIFGSLQQVGEGMSATMTRLFTEQQVMLASFKLIGVVIPFTGEASIKLADALVNVSSNAEKAAERLKEFAQQEADFYKNFIPLIQQVNDTAVAFGEALSDIFTSAFSKLQVKAATAALPVTIKNTADPLKEQAAIAQATFDASLASYLRTKKKTLAMVRGVWANHAVLTNLNAKVAVAVSNDAIAKAAAEAKQAEERKQLAKKYGEDIVSVVEKAKAAYAVDATISNLVNLKQAQKEYNYYLANGVPLILSLQDIFINTFLSTQDFGTALVEVKRNLDLSTDAGKKAYASLNQIGTAFTSLANDVLKPVKDQITSIGDAIDSRTKEQLLAALSTSRDYTEQKSLSVKITKLIVDKYNTEKTAINNMKTAFISLGETVKNMLLGTLSILNPMEKLTQAQANYQDLLTKSRSSDVTVASDAIGKLGAASQTYLTEAMSFYGASGEYATIFKQVTDTLSNVSLTGTSITNTAINAIEALGKSAMFDLGNLAVAIAGAFSETIMGTITATGSGTESSSDALQALLKNTRQISGYADGGLASGLSLVGERGPELVRLPTNTRVSNNNTTNRILQDSNKETIKILSDMKNELVVLNDRMGTIERKTRLSKPMLSAA